jgi:hypothetical protein
VSGPEVVHEGGVRAPGAHADAAPRQVLDDGQRRQQHVVPLGLGVRPDAQQLTPVPRALDRLGRVHSRLRHVDASRWQGVGVEQPSPGPPAGRDHRRRRGEGRTLPGPGQADVVPRQPAAQRHVDQDHQAQAARLDGQQFRDHGGDQPVHQHERPIGDLREDPAQASQRRRVGTGPRPGCGVLVHRPPESGEARADPAVVGVAAARTPRVVDGVRHDDVDGGHSCRS